MEFSVTLISAGLLIVLLWLLNLKSRRQFRLPPGPSGLPVIGNLLQFDKRAPFKTLLKVRVISSPLNCAFVVSSGFSVLYSLYISPGVTFCNK